MQNDEVLTAVTMAKAAGHQLAQRLAAMKAALEAGREDKAIEIAREITKVVNRAA